MYSRYGYESDRRISPFTFIFGFAVGAIAATFIVLAGVQDLTSEPIDVSVQKHNKEEYTVDLDLRDQNKEYTAYDIEVVGGKATINLLAEEEK